VSECSWGFDERSGANPAIMPSLPSLAVRQRWTPPRISYRRDAEGRSCGRGVSGAAEGRNLDLTPLEPRPARLVLPACLPALPCLALTRRTWPGFALSTSGLDSGLWTLDSGLLSACAVAPLCCPTLAHSLTHSIPAELWHAAAFHRYPTLRRLAPPFPLPLDPGPDPEILAVAAV
jgi:hypothetical protein